VQAILIGGDIVNHNDSCSDTSRGRALDQSINHSREIYDRLVQIVGHKGVVTDPQRIEAMTTAWRDGWPSEPAFVVQPASTAEVQSLVSLCVSSGLSIVSQGGNTGMAGGALPRAGQRDLLLSMSRMNKIRAIDLDDDMIVADAGCILDQVREAAAEVGRLFPLSLGAQGSCTIGGNVATNAGGIHVLRYGQMRELVAGLEVVLADGRLWNGLRRLRKDNSGYDLKHLFIGSEGTLGIVTAAVLKLSAIPTQSVTTIVAVREPAHALAWLRRLRRRFAVQLTACELIEQICVSITLRRMPDLSFPILNKFPWYVLSEISTFNPSEDVETAVAEEFSEALVADEVADGATASSLKQAKNLWRLRESIADAHRMEGVSFKHDISVPISMVPKFISLTMQRLSERMPGIRSFSFGHLGDGNVHFNPLQAADEPAEKWRGRLAEVNRITHDTAIELGGSISAEHGIGQLRRSELLHYKGGLDLELMTRVKTALDPGNLLNPGKVLYEK
jgi:FAD/FMN-containing dehydrogenase